jgi:hypothetical protein
MQKWKLYTYDVHGNPNDGWEVNDVRSNEFECETEEEDGYDAWAEIRQAMIGSGLLTHQRKIAPDESSDNSQTIYLVDTTKKSGGYKPVGELRKI